MQNAFWGHWCVTQRQWILGTCQLFYHKSGAGRTAWWTTLTCWLCIKFTSKVRERSSCVQSLQTCIVLNFLIWWVTLKWYQSRACWTAPMWNSMSYKNCWSLEQCLKVNPFAVISNLPFYLDNKKSHFNSNKEALLPWKLWATLKASYHVTCGNDRICVILKSGKMINTKSQIPAHTQQQHVLFGHASQGSIFLWHSSLLVECISATPKSSFPYHQACQRFHCNTKVTPGTEVWEQVLVFLGYKMRQGGEKWKEGEEVTANRNSAGSSTASSKFTDYRKKKSWYFTIWRGWKTL